jgi:hypothetical protein
MVSLSQHLFALRLFTIELGEIVECCIELGIELAASAILTDVGDFAREPVGAKPIVCVGWRRARFDRQLIF